jgi:hypothetical protein
MTCDTFRQWFLDHESDEMTDAIRSHLAVCDKCQQIFALDQVFEQKLQNSFEQLDVPARLQERLDQNMRGSTRWMKQSRRLRQLVAPALAVAALLLFFLFPLASEKSSFASMDTVGQLAISDHLSHGTKGCNSSALLDLESYSLKELGYAVKPPIVPEGAKLLAAAKCRLGDCDTLHLMYSLAGKPFSVFVFPKEEAEFTLVADRSYSLDFGNHQVTLWQTGEQIQAMVI